MEDVSKKNNINKVIIILSIILVLILSLCIYKSFNKKEPDISDSDTSKPTNKEKSSNQEQVNTSSKVVYKTKNNKQQIEVYPKNDKEILDKLKKNGLTDTTSPDNYIIYNNKIISVKKEKTGNRTLYIGDEVENETECKEYHFIVDNETNELLDLNYDEQGYYNYITTINNKEFIIETACHGEQKNIYNSNLKRLGSKYLGFDNNNYYVLDTNIVKYDNDDNEVYRTDQVFLPGLDDQEVIIEKHDTLLYNGTLYIVINNERDIYIVDTSHFGMINFASANDYQFDGNNFKCMKIENNKLVIYLKNRNNEIVNFIYDMEMKMIEKENENE